MEKVEILNIDTGNSEQTLKELKDLIKDLRKELDGCTIGSDKFKDTLDELTTAQDKLKKATKSSNEALEGSYDALVQKMADLRKAWKATADEAERADLGSQIAEINSQLKDMDASIGNYQRNVGDYASAFDNVTMKIEGGVAKFDRFNGAARSVIGSFDLVEGGLKAIGVESEEVNGLMDKMQGAMMLTNGLNSVKEGVLAFNSMRTAIQTTTAASKVLNVVMSANPIGAIITAVAALTAGAIALSNALSKDKESAKALEVQYDKTTRAIENQSIEMSHQIELMEAMGVERDKIMQQQIADAKMTLSKLETEYLMLRAKLEDLGTLFTGKQREELEKQIDEMFEKYEAQAKLVLELQRDYEVYLVQCQTELKKKMQEEAEERERLARETDERLEKEHAEFQETLLKHKMTASEKSIHALKKTYDKELALLNELYKRKLIPEEVYQQELKAIKEKYESGVAEINTADEQKKQEEYDRQRAMFEQLQNDLLESQMTANEKRLHEIHSTYIKELEMLEDLHAKKIISEEEYSDALIAIKEKEAQEIAAAQQAAQTEATNKADETNVESVETWGKTLQEKLDLTDEQVQGISAGVNLLGTSLTQTSQLLDALANSQNQNSKEGFETAKKLNIASAVMQMLNGIVSSWASAMQLGPIAGPIMGGVLTAFTTTLGMININKIKSTTFNNPDGAAGGSKTTIPNINTASLIANPINYTTEVKGAQAEEAIPQRVYVVETDITDAQTRAQITQDESVW